MQKPLHLTYIIGTYPGLTTTFIDREIIILRQLGVDLQILSIRRPTNTKAFSREQQDLQQGVIYLLPVSWFVFVTSILYFVLLHPLTYFKTLLYLVTRPHPDWRTWLMTFPHFALGVYAAFLLRRQSPHQFHAHFADRATTVALVVSRLLKVPYSLTAHANDIYVKPVMLREKLTNAKFITTCTQYNEVYLRQKMGDRLNGKLHLVYHGLDLSNYHPSLKLAEDNNLLILSIGRLTEKKGFTYLISACHRLKEKGYNIKCDIIGEGPLRQQLAMQIDQLGLQNVVTLCGAISHEAVIEKYQQATLFVLPCIVSKDGDRDGIPNVLIEAMAMQLPVVSTRLSGIPELIEDGHNGMLIAPGDEDALTEALQNLLDNASLRAELGYQGCQTVARKFDVEQNVYRLFDLFAKNMPTSSQPKIEQLGIHQKN